MIAIITASYSAIGRELTARLLADGYKVVALNRNSLKSTEQKESIGTAADRFETLSVDLRVPADISEAARKIRTEYGQVKVLFNNAGFAGAEARVLPNGVEEHFQVNTLAPLQLVQQLPLDPGAIVCNLGSSAMFMARKVITDPAWHRENFKKMIGPYAHSKMALAQLASSISAKPESSEFTILTVDPGPTKSDMSASEAMPGLVKFLRPFFSSPAKAALSVYAACFNSAHATGSFVQGAKSRTIFPAGQELWTWFSQHADSWL